MDTAISDERLRQLVREAHSGVQLAEVSRELLLDNLEFEARAANIYDRSRELERASGCLRKELTQERESNGHLTKKYKEVSLRTTLFDCLSSLVTLDRSIETFKTSTNTTTSLSSCLYKSTTVETAGFWLSDCFCACVRLHLIGVRIS